MKNNLLLYGVAAFILFRVIKNRRDNAAAAAVAAANAADFARIKGSSAAQAQELTTQQSRTSM
jgi:hypothetical protein